MTALTTDVHMQLFSKVFNHSRQHIVWNSGDFFMDGLLWFFKGLRSMVENFRIEVPS